jgi:hypothetical protein
MPPDKSLKLTRLRRGWFWVAGHSRWRCLEGLKQDRAAADARPLGGMRPQRQSVTMRRLQV